VKRPKILCVDDRADSLRVRALLLEQFGCEAITATNGESALQEMMQDKADLLLIDYHLGRGETGDALARDVRARWPEVPIIMLTGDPRIPKEASDCVEQVLIPGAGTPGTLLDASRELLPNAPIKPSRPMLVTNKKEGAA